MSLVRAAPPEFERRVAVANFEAQRRGGAVAAELTCQVVDAVQMETELNDVLCPKAECGWRSRLASSPVRERDGEGNPRVHLSGERMGE